MKVGHYDYWIFENNETKWSNEQFVGKKACHECLSLFIGIGIIIQAEYVGVLGCAHVENAGNKVLAIFFPKVLR
jgi:hypothetical protein